MGSKNQTVTQKADPWKPTQGPMKNAVGTLQDMMQAGDFTSDPYGGNRVAGFGGDTHASQNMIRQAAGGPQLTPQASGTLSSLMGGDSFLSGLTADGGFVDRMMSPNYQSGLFDQVKQNALGSAIPAATSMFSGSGMTNSSAAMDHVGRAATEAVAPLEYQAQQNALDRSMAAAGLGMGAVGQNAGMRMNAAGMAPTMDRAAYIPGMMMGTVGAQNDALQQQYIDADMKRHYETQGMNAQNFQGYLDNLLRLSGQGGASSSTQPGTSGLENIAAGGLTGIGTYGALMANPMTAPFAIPLGIGAGIAGMI